MYRYVELVGRRLGGWVYMVGAGDALVPDECVLIRGGSGFNWGAETGWEHGRKEKGVRCLCMI